MDHQCLVLNPGYLTKSQQGGTYARLVVHPLPKEELEEALRHGGGGHGEEEEGGGEGEGADMFHGVAGRCKVEIIQV